MNILQVYAGLRQLAYPPELRIVPERWQWSFVAEPPPEEGSLGDSGPGSGPQPEAPPPALPIKLAIDLGNQLFRMERTLARGDGADMRALTRGIAQVRKLLESENVEILDLKGQPFVVGRADFEALGRGEPDASVTHPTILFCERPAIYVAGRLFQAAKGVVVVPPVPADATETQEMGGESEPAKGEIE